MPGRRSRNTFPTEAHGARQALRESEVRFRDIADHAPVITWVTDPSGYCTYLNRRWYEFTGQTPEQAEGFGWLDATHPDDKAEAERIFLEANARQEAFRLEYRLRRADGAYRWAIDAASPRFGADGSFLGYVGSVIDIDERRAAETALRESETRYRTLFESVEQGFCVFEVLFDGEGRPTDYVFVEVNPAFEAQTGLVDAVGRRIGELAPGHEQRWYDLYGEVALTGTPLRVEDYAQVLGRWYEIYAYRIGEPEQRRVAALFNDVSERKRAEARIRELNETLERRVVEALAERRVLADVIDGTDIFVQVADREFNWLAINDAAAAEFARIFGVRRPKAGDNMLQMLDHRPDDRAAVEAVWVRALAGEEFIEIDEFGAPSLDRRYYEMRFRTLRGADGQAIGAYQFVSDVTGRLREQARLKDAEEALRQSQKMEAIGSLTGGVAHDFNNLLTPIVGALDMLQRRGVGGEREQRLIGGAAQSADRARLLVQRLLAFARRQPLQPVAVDIGKLASNMADLVSSTTGPQIKVVVDAPHDLPPAKADPNQLEMALLNLAVNARDAMPDGGTLRISASADTIRAGVSSTLRPGRYVRLSVADTGTGMDEATLARAVEPFFSTKGVGKGTGLGLSMVHGLASQLGGELTIGSRPGLGTNVELWLPQTEEAPETPAVTHEEEQPRARRGTALLVDDEELVRLSTADMLSDLGFRVVEAASAEEALGMIGSGPRIDLVITDHLMPGMTGTDLARAVRDRWPKLPVLVVSGYAEVDGIAPDLPRLTKPFRKDDLAASLAGLVSPKVA